MRFECDVTHSTASVASHTRKRPSAELMSKSDELELFCDEFGLESDELEMFSDEFGLESDELGLFSDELGHVSRQKVEFSLDRVSRIRYHGMRKQQLHISVGTPSARRVVLCRSSSVTREPSAVLRGWVYA